MIFGAKYICAAPITAETAAALPVYGPGFPVGALNQVTENITYATVKGYGDDRTTHQRTDMTGGTVDVQVTDLELTKRAAFYGATMRDGKLISKLTDVAPPFGLAYYMDMQEPDTGAIYYEVHYFSKVIAQRQNLTATTVGESVTYQYLPIKFEVQRPKFAEFEHDAVFSTEAEAIAYIDNLLNVQAWHVVQTGANGAGTVSPSGAGAVADGEDLVFTFTPAAPAAVYLDGAEVTSAVANGAYTLSAVSQDHALTAIFTA